MFKRDEGDERDIYHTSVRDKAPGDSYEVDQTPVVTKPDDLDSAEMRDRHGVLMGHYMRELDRQAENRRLMERDEGLYDHDQWDPQVAQALMDRGQVPIVYNVTQTAINWVLGSERRTPMDYKILPRRKEGLKHAERKSELMKYISDVNNTGIHFSRAFKEQVIAGLSWMETGAQDPDDGEVVYERYESWRNILHDSTADEMDCSDGRYMFRTKWIDVDRACAMFAKRKQTILRSIETVHGSYGNMLSTGDQAMDSREEQSFQGITGYSDHTYAPRNRVRLYEGWYQTPIEEKMVRGGDFTGEVFDPWSPGHRADVENGRAEVVTKVRERMHVAIFTNDGLLFHGPSPYRHNKFPFTPMWGYRRASDGMPYGMVRGVYDIQMDTNKRASKMLYHLTAQRVLVEKGSVDDIEQLREEASRPDAVIEYNPGHQPPQIVNDLNIAAAHGQAMDRNINMIQQTSGVTDENMGRTTNATSGKAIMARQDQGQLTTSLYFENLRFARRLHGEKVLCNIEQFFTEEKQFRITNSRGNPEYVAINTPDEDGDDNHITKTKADYIVSEEDYHATTRQANVAMLMEMVMPLASANPQFLMSILDLVVEALDPPKRDEIVKRIRQQTGIADPDADPNNPDPETIAMEEQKAKAAAMQARAQEAEIAGLEGKAAESQAKARKTAAEAKSKEGESVKETLDNMETAIRSAVSMLGSVGAGKVADQIMAAAITEAQRQSETQAMAEAQAAAGAMQAQQPQQSQTTQDPSLQGEVMDDAAPDPAQMVTV